MRNSRWALRSAVVTAVGLAAATALPTGLASAQVSASAAAHPMVKLILAQKTINVPRFGKRAFIDTGAYVIAVGSPLRFNVQRASYAKPITNTQIISLASGGTTRRPLPNRTVKSWNGLHRFVRITMRNSSGKIVAAHLGSFCPNDFGQPSGPNAPRRSPFPQECASDPFQLANAWGIQRGWGVDAGFISAKVPLGKYKVTVNITRYWQRVLHLTPSASTRTVTVKVVKPSQCGGFICTRPATKHHKTRHGALPVLPANVPTLANPPSKSLPDLTPLPSWGIRVFHFGGAHKSDQLSFGATVWSGGNSRLDVEGFRKHGEPVMKAYQYFWKNGHIIGRARAGTMGFDDKPGHTHWHFEQFAQYRLLAKNKTSIVKRRKVGVCIAPTDPVNLLLRNALWQPSFIGFGACGSQSALSVQEMMPIGWGDTYQQFLPGQAFNISHLRNGVYYIEIIANPNKVLHETNYRNDVSLRKVILGGTPGHRTVKVPAIHGIDPEHMG
jgi:hypothetical protein